MPTGRPSPFGPGGRGARQPVWGGQPLPLPLTAAIGVNNQTASTANLVGTVNPQGQTGTCWFSYGSTPQLGTLTPPQPIQGSLPLTITATASVLSGSTVWFALVASTPAGTVTSSPLSFLAGAQPAVTTATSPLVPTAIPQVAVPHYAFPITFTPTGGIGVVEQDTLAEVFANVQAIAACTPGECPELPDLGLPDLAFGLAPVDPAPVVAAIRRQEPRASETTISQALADPNTGSWQVTLTTEYSGAD